MGLVFQYLLLHKLNSLKKSYPLVMQKSLLLCFLPVF